MDLLHSMELMLDVVAVIVAKWEPGRSTQPPSVTCGLGVLRRITDNRLDSVGVLADITDIELN